MRISKKMSWVVIRGAGFPLILFSLLLTGYMFYKAKITPLITSQLDIDFRKYINTAIILCIGFIIHRAVGIIMGWYRDNIAVKTSSALDDEFVPLIRRSIKIIVWIVVLLVILPLYGININALIATLGVTSLAIALAAQDTIANIISGFLIMIDRPFRVGDRIKLPSGENVEVLDIGVRRSKFLSQDEAIIIVPNLDLSKSKIVNYTYGEEFKK